jgi:hypothetical protein
MLIRIFRSDLWMEPRYHSHYSDEATFRTVKESIPDRARGFSPLPTVHTSSEGHQPPIQWIPRVKQPELEADHSLLWC